MSFSFHQPTSVLSRGGGLMQCVQEMALARLTSPFVAGCVNSFRDTYARTGMNLIQRMAVLAVALGREVRRIWPVIEGGSDGTRPT
jgi:hypothetical protein